MAMDIQYQTDAYVFLDIGRPHVAWATYRGKLVTIPPEPQGFISLWFGDMLRQKESLHFKKEWALEQVRQGWFASRISRLRGFFCFPDFDSASRASRIWNTSGKDNYNLENLAEISLAETDGREVYDSNWITHSHDIQLEWMQHYWNGDPFPNEEPVWEKLVEGNVVVLGTRLRERAYEVVKAEWPNSLRQLEISRLAALVGSDLGVIQAFLRELEDEYLVEYYANWRDAENPEFLSKLVDLISGGHPINRRDIQPWFDQGSFGHKPDMTAFGFAIPKHE